MQDNLIDNGNETEWQVSLSAYQTTLLLTLPRQRK